MDLRLSLIGLFLLAGSVGTMAAELEVCNRTDLSLLVAVSYEEESGMTSEGWWKIYPGMCAVPVDVTTASNLKNYWVHAESSPTTTVPADQFSWGEDLALCVELNDFRLPDATSCDAEGVKVQFSRVPVKDGGNHQVLISNPARSYPNETRSMIAGMERMLEILGIDTGPTFGVLGKATIEPLNKIAAEHQVLGLDFEKLFPIVEKMIMERDG